jgi:hypothetical protein
MWSKRGPGVNTPPPPPGPVICLTHPKCIRVFVGVMSVDLTVLSIKNRKMTLRVRCADPGGAGWWGFRAYKHVGRIYSVHGICGHSFSFFFSAERSLFISFQLFRRGWWREAKRINVNEEIAMFPASVARSWIVCNQDAVVGSSFLRWRRHIGRQGRLHTSWHHFIVLVYIGVKVVLLLCGKNTDWGCLSTECWEEHRLGVFEYRVLRRTQIGGVWVQSVEKNIWTKRGKVTGGWRKFHIEEFHNLYSSEILFWWSNQEKWHGLDM